MSTSNDINEKNLNFEEALLKLESIVESMENGDVPLNELVAKFEEGSALLKYCNSHLNEAELKIEKLKENSDQSEPFFLNRPLSKLKNDF